MRANIVLVDSQLELSPPGEKVPILDSSIHRHLLEGTASKRRGRPDIVHRFLSLCLDSGPGRQGRVRPFVHTVDGIIIEALPGSNIPWNYLDFLDQMGSLLRGQEAAGFKIREERNIEQLVSNLACDSVIVLSPKGERIALERLYEKNGLEQVVLLIGGFSEGDYTTDVRELADAEVSLGTDLLKVWTVTCEVLASLGHE